MADYLVIIVVAIGGLCLLFDIPKKDRYQTYVRIIMMGLTALLLAKLVTLVFHPDELRPFVASGQAPLAAYLNNPGFPSDHMLLVSTITFAVWVTTKRFSTTLLLAILSVIVGVGRIIARVHTPLDIIGGLVIALIAVLLWYRQDSFKAKLSRNP